jgi:hypothetical protein
MKIKYKNEPTIVKFSSLKPGVVFRATDDETIYMKIAKQKDTDCNSISLVRGTPAYFADYDDLLLLNATLVIEQ